MWWLKARSRRSLEDRGAMALIVAIVVPVVLLGIGAVVVDVGGWYAGRAQDQNGADAAAVAVANTCATGACDTTAASKFVDTASSPNGDLSHQYAACGNSSTGGLNPCANVDVPSTSQPVLENGHVCPKAPSSASANYVDVLTVPKNSDGSNTMSSLFGKGKQQVAACSQVQWGPLQGGTGLALTMSLCAWELETGGTTNPTFATPEPPYPASGWPTPYPFGKVKSSNPVKANPGGENVIQVHGDAKACASSPSGQNLPGGFAWLADDAQCNATIDVNGYVSSDPGNNDPPECTTQLKAIYNATKTDGVPNDLNPIAIPIFDMACGSDGKLQPDDTTACPSGMPTNSYHIAGYATFVLTGYNLGSQGLDNPSLINNGDVCNGSNITCLYGMFTKGLVKSQGDICTSNCGTDYGAPVVVKLTG
jgi:Flp pilus assembly protein TadG